MPKTSHHYIKDIREQLLGTEEEVSFEPCGYYILKSFAVRKDKNGGDYCEITLCDASGELGAKIWKSNGQREGVKLEQGRIVYIRQAYGSVFNKKPQIKFNIEAASIIEKADDSIRAYLPKTPREESVKRLEEIFQVVETIENEDMRSIVSTILEENREKLLSAPAAEKLHHSEYGGLLLHVGTMLKNAQYMRNVYPMLNRDLLLSGVILHDISKLEEIDSNEIGQATGYTVSGHLIGHLALGAIKLAKTAERLGTNPEIALLLEHMLLSHHGIPEFGSVRYPMIPEAEMLHFLDNIDAKMYDYEKALRETRLGEMSPNKISANKGEYKFVYRHSFFAVEEEEQL